MLNRVRMLRPLPMAAVDDLARQLAHAEFEAGQMIVRQGDHGDRFYVIADGEADVTTDGRLIRTLTPGEGFGEIALLRDTPRTATVSARTPLQVFTLDRRHFLAAVSGYQSSMVEADRLMRERLGTFDPASAPTTR